MIRVSLPGKTREARIENEDDVASNAIPRSAARYYNNLEDMIGYRPCMWWKFCWVFLTPCVCFGVFVFSLVQYRPLKYIDYVYPWWGQLVGWILALSTMLCIPGYAIYKFIVTPGDIRTRCKELFRPDVDIATEIRARKHRERRISATTV
ncbi:hypothetical protein HPB51_020844 [Rhipicephalus microplus]|uniref:Uncharacterized protein n=1 Tax=Rhipicephalus microplus TaxID=6941 RepID=A0A9J6ECG3_RHIMP|nr:hypothetical protein HPB51_020844 [Rhipicephalus microplus]